MTNPLPASYSKTTSVPLKIGNKTGMSSFISLIQHSTGSPNHSNQTKRRNKRHPNWKGRNKTVFICSWHGIVQREPKDSTKKLLELINEFSKVPGYWMDIQKSVAFLYANNELTGWRDGEKMQNIIYFHTSGDYQNHYKYVQFKKDTPFFCVTRT